MKLGFGAAQSRNWEFCFGRRSGRRPHMCIYVHGQFGGGTPSPRPSGGAALQQLNFSDPTSTVNFGMKSTIRHIATRAKPGSLASLDTKR